MRLSPTNLLSTLAALAVLAGVAPAAAAAQCDDDGCAWPDAPPLPPAPKACTPGPASHAAAAMRRIAEHWIMDHGNSCTIDESDGAARLVAYPPAGVPAAAFRADLELVRQAYQGWANGSGHTAWGADFDRVAYDFCKRLGHDTIAMVSVQDQCPGTSGDVAFVRYATSTPAGRAQRARAHFLIQLTQRAALPDAVGGSCPAGAQCAYVGP